MNTDICDWVAYPVSTIMLASIFTDYLWLTAASFAVLVLLIGGIMIRSAETQVVDE